jgi:hypothetical protein
MSRKDRRVSSERDWTDSMTKGEQANRNIVEAANAEL